MDKYKWNLNKIFESEDKFNNAINEINNNLNKISKYKGKILDNLYDTLYIDEQIDMLCEKVYVYSHLGYYDNLVDEYFIKCKEKSVETYMKSNEVRSFINPEILSYDYKEVQNVINKDKRLEKYKFLLEMLFRYKTHTLSEKEESILSSTSQILRVPENAFVTLNNSDIVFSKIRDENNKLVALTNSNYSIYMTSKNENVRKRAFNSMYKFYKGHINTISELYVGSIKGDYFISKIRNYKNPLSMSLYSDNIDEELYNKLINITNKNINSLQKYYSIKSKVLNKKLHMYDTYVNISVTNEKKIKYSEAIKIVNNALNVLGSDYLKAFNELLNSNSVDVYPKDNKRSGAYEWGTYKVDPYVSLNYENNIDSLSTLIHEMGHAMHTYYSNKYQEYIYASTPIFLAEIASTVNEILLSEYLINNTKDRNEKIYYLVEFLDKFKATVYRQTMFAEFEKIIYEKVYNNEVITANILCDEYFKLNEKHFSKELIVDENIKYEWARIPHFYTSFYVYKYATGFISALVIANNLLHDKEFKNKYIEFLSSGSNDYPINILKKLGIDINDEKVLASAFKIFNDKVIYLEKLLNEKGEE